MDKFDLDKEREEGAEHDELKVTDRRLFDADGRLRQDLDGDTEEAEPDQPEPTAPEPGFERRPLDEPEGVDFTMLINAMAQPALIYLGEIEHPETGKPEINLEQARLQIDMLELLQIKCRGNLTDDEVGLLDGLLYQLRMRFVARSDEKQQPPG